MMKECIEQRANGVVILEVLNKSEKFICCKIDANYQPYVTWLIDVRNNYQSGHYFDNPEDALKDFEERQKYQ